MKEYLLTTNDYMEPGVVTGADAYSVLLVRLLLLEPGTNPLHPEMGVGLGPRYRYITDDDINPLKERIENQISTYIPSTFGGEGSVSVSLVKKEKSNYMYIYILTQNTKFVYDTEISETPIELSTLIS